VTFHNEDRAPVCVQLSAFHSTGERTTSASIAVRVYPPLQLNPQALVLAPGASLPVSINHYVLLQ